ASRMTRPVVAVVLESDVAAVFDSSAKVNAQLRSAISARKRRKPVPGCAGIVDGRANRTAGADTRRLTLTSVSVGPVLLSSHRCSHTTLQEVPQKRYKLVESTAEQGSEKTATAK